jgi:hypothetical protein
MSLRVARAETSDRGAHDFRGAAEVCSQDVTDAGNVLVLRTDRDRVQGRVEQQAPAVD